MAESRQRFSIFFASGRYTNSLRNQCLSDPHLRVIECVSSLQAGYAADGYARASGVGVCIVDVSDGAAVGVLKAISGAYNENLAVICVICGPEFSPYMRQLFSPTISCHQVVVNDLNEAQRSFDTAALASLNNHKPVFISFTCEVSDLSFGEITDLPPLESNMESLCSAVEQATKLLNEAWDVVMVVGPELRFAKACDAFFELANASHYGLAVMPNGQGLVPETHPRFVGTLCGHNNVNENDCKILVELAGACVLVGPRPPHFDFLSEEKTIVVQGNNVKVGTAQSLPDVLMKDFFDLLAITVKKKKFPYDWGAGTPAQPQPQPLEANDLFTADLMLKNIEALLGADTTLILETELPVTVGRKGSHLNCQELQLLLPKGCGYEFQRQYKSIGWSVGATLGYAQAAPGKRAICVITDRFFQDCCQYLSTMLSNEQNNMIFVLKNESEEATKKWNYRQLVNGMDNGDGNCWCAEVSTEEEMKKVVELATGAKKNLLCLIEVKISW